MKVFAISSLFVAAVIASPVAEAQKPKKLIDLWQQPKFLNLKFSGSGSENVCNNLKQDPIGRDFVNKVQSGKSQPGERCTIWPKEDCAGEGFSFDDKQGAPELPKWINNKAKSWKCVPGLK